MNWQKIKLSKEAGPLKIIDDMYISNSDGLWNLTTVCRGSLISKKGITGVMARRMIAENNLLPVQFLGMQVYRQARCNESFHAVAANMWWKD